MKAITYTTAILMTLIIGAPAMFGQRSVKSEPREQRETTTVKRTQNRQVQQQRKPQTATIKSRSGDRTTQSSYNTGRRTTEVKAVQRTNNYSTGHRTADVKTVQRSKNYNSGHRTAEVKAVQRTKNYNSGHRTPEVNNRQRTTEARPVRTNKYSTKRYYSNNHYHNVHPTRKVNVHHHRDTYMHNYHVLYYPAYNNIYWSRNMYHDYHRWYPNYNWRYEYGHRIQTISVFDAKYNMGEVAMIYGRVSGTWHNQETDDYLLFFGGDYPYQQFTLVVPGRVARRFSWRPERYFLGEHLTITGLITTYDGIPEIIVKNKRQLGIY
jgi:hypothetical protein